LFIALSATMAHAQEPLKVSVHAAPPGFYEFLLLHDDDAKFDRSGKWVSSDEADLVLVFAKNKDALGLVPANWWNVFEVLVPKTQSHLYYMPAGTLEDPLASHSILILMDRFEESVGNWELELPTREVDRDRFLSCFSAGFVVDQFSNASFKETLWGNAERCNVWIEAEAG